MLQSTLVHVSVAESFSKVSMFLISMDATWSAVTEFPLMQGISIVFSST